MDHSRIRSLPLLALKVKFFSERPLDPLDFDFSAASWSPAAEARHAELTFETECHPLRCFIIAHPLPAVGEVFVVQYSCMPFHCCIFPRSQKQQST